MTGACRAQHLGSAHFTLTEKCGGWQGMIVKIMKAHSMDRREVQYRLPHIILKTVPVALDTIGRGSIIA